MKLVFDSEEDEVLVEVVIEEDEDGEKGVVILINNFVTDKSADVWISFDDFAHIMNFVDYTRYIIEDKQRNQEAGVVNE